jgi:hypothetical protein
MDNHKRFEITKSVGRDCRFICVVPSANLLLIGLMVLRLHSLVVGKPKSNPWKQRSLSDSRCLTIGWPFQTAWTKDSGQAMGEGTPVHVHLLDHPNPSTCPLLACCLQPQASICIPSRFNRFSWRHSLMNLEAALSVGTDEIRRF